MFSHDMKEKKNREVKIEDAEPDTVELFLKYLYEADLSLETVDQAFSLMRMADKYNISSLAAHCLTYLFEKLSLDNVVQVSILAYLHKDDDLKSAAISLMGNFVGPLSNLNNWKTVAEYPFLALEIAEKMKTFTPSLKLG